MHIPGFGRQAVIPGDKHVISLEDNSDAVDEQDEPDHNEAQVSPAASQSLEAADEPVRLKHHTIACGNGLIEVLYENQRGSHICGIPLYSSAGLWPTDPYAWTNMDHKYSPFTIFNATLPDPSWQWEWKRWYVDMSGDVDENGWAYNFLFSHGHWHGHHMWWHSFVRRRRWLRKRVRGAPQERASRKMRNPAEDYFTIYSSVHHDRTQPVQGQSIDDLIASPAEDTDGFQQTKLENLGDFYDRLKSCRLDREKIEAMDNFLRYGTDLSALAGEMRRILSCLIFQQSKRQLLALLAVRCQNMEKQHVEADIKDRNGMPRHQCVKDAIQMTEELVNKLDYWSDKVKLTRIEEDAELDRITAIRLAELNSQQKRAKSYDDHPIKFKSPAKGTITDENATSRIQTPEEERGHE